MKNSLTAKIKTPVLSILLYISSVIAGLLAIAGLTNNILIFKKAFSYYQVQGFTPDIILEELLPSQLLPGIFEPIGLYGGMALLLFTAGIINKRVAHYLSSTPDSPNSLDTNADNNSLSSREQTMTDDSDTSVENPK